MFPVFFSVSSLDVAFAEEIWKSFPSDWIYLYSKSGEEGVHMWDEISRQELPQSKVMVIFWSKNYIRAAGCVRELLQSKELVQRGQLRAIILRMDTFPFTWDDSLGSDVHPAFEALAEMLPYRTSSPNVSLDQATNIIQRVVGPILDVAHPQLPRLDLHQTLRKIVQKERFSYYPAVWVSGFNGVGRETLVRAVNINFAPNGQGFVVDINEASLPKQIALRIESRALSADFDRLHQLTRALSDNDTDFVANTIERVFLAGNFVILRHSRVVEENIELPEWLDEVVNKLSSSTRPKLFIISQLPLSSERRTRCRDNLVAQRVPTVDEFQITDFCYELIGHFDSNAARWSEDEVSKIVQASAGTLGFLVSLVRAAAGIEDFDQIDQLVANDTRSIASSITVYLNWAIKQLQGFDDELKVLLFLNDISPCDIIDLQKNIEARRPFYRVIGKLIELGLVERESDNVFRLTPLIARRIGRDLTRPDLVESQRRSLLKIIEKPIEIEEGDDYLRIETRIQASNLAGADHLPPNLMGFVSAAHWFQAGIRLYYARHREPAYKLLKKAYNHRSSFSNNSRLELTRYFCLSATQNRHYDEASTCIELLDNVFSTKGMAAFLQADLFQHQRKFPEAIRDYKRALELNKGKEGRLERTYRPLIRCILESSHPDFAEAEQYAKASLNLRRTIFSLMAKAQVYLHWKYRGARTGSAPPNDIDHRYSESLSDLESQPGVGSAPFEIKAEEAEFSGEFEDAASYMSRAIKADPRFELRNARWLLMAKSKTNQFAEQAIAELNSARVNPEFRANWMPFLPALALTYGLALKSANRPLAALNSFAPELTSDEIGDVLKKVRRSS